MVRLAGNAPAPQVPKTRGQQLLSHSLIIKFGGVTSIAARFSVCKTDVILLYHNPIINLVGIPRTAREPKGPKPSVLLLYYIPMIWWRCRGSHPSPKKRHHSVYMFS